MEDAITISRLRIRTKSPFFATLSLFAEFKPTFNLDTAATDGKVVFYNPDFLANLPPNQQDGLIVHELLHAALLHNIRRKEREPRLWNIAADIVVNGLIVQDTSYELPPGGIRYPEWETKSVEEIYELLLQQGDQCKFELSMSDLLASSQVNNAPESISTQQQKDLKAYWNDALQQAAVIARTTNQGKLPAGIERQLGELAQAQIDWRTYLWRYLVQTPTDFQGFDRRFIGQGLYLEMLLGESVQVFVAIDTSGSISNEQMKSFYSELLGILGSYPHLNCQLYYADAAIYGPYQLKPNNDLPKPRGGGGTSFIPFFTAVEKHRDVSLEGVCVYLTDGYGDFPQYAPSLPVLWVVTPGGLDNQGFPFGEVVRLIK
ncbi:MAG: hypothetical protein EA365_00515 [Gloeocapsa sp. DLM2.Bin57]|nr:MAG: hypothetical protein EA365_00515 [Gloeocapsa sp. DLM2.Bin57]